MKTMNMSLWTRRKFLKFVGATGMASFLTGVNVKKSGLSATEPSDGIMPTRPFGKTGVSVPILGFGGSQSLEFKQRLLRQAVTLGVTYWDTAETYANGGSEAAMGQYFKRYPEDRKKVFLVTKSRNNRPSGLSDSLTGSLKRLNTTYIDLYLIHDISDIEEMSSDIRAWADQVKAEGKVRFIGFSAHSNMEACMMGAAKLGWIDGIMVTYNYRLMYTDIMKQAVEACTEAGIGLTAMKTQAGWSWGRTGRKTRTTEQLIRSFSEKGFTEKQAKLKAVWENPVIATVCSEMTNFKILLSNAAAAKNRIKLSLDDHQLLNRYAQATASEYCAGCAVVCESLLEKKIPVCDTMRYLMYARWYGEHQRAAVLFKEIPLLLRGQMANIDYTAAERACPQHMPIGRLMKAATVQLT